MDDSIVVTYWLPYFFNNGFNEHEGDWEFVAVILRPGSGIDEVTPVAAAYSQHLEGLARWWPGSPEARRRLLGQPLFVEVEDGTHPAVFVARGSHASYFEGGRTYQGLTDAVAESAADAIAFRSFGTEANMTIVMLPDVTVGTSVENLPSDFGWLVFPGRWGQRGEDWTIFRPLETFADDGPRGPVFSHAPMRWTNPYEWYESLPKNL